MLFLITKCPLCTKLYRETLVYMLPSITSLRNWISSYWLVTSRILTSWKETCSFHFWHLAVTQGRRGYPCSRGPSTTVMAFSRVLSYLFWTARVTRKLGKWKRPAYITEMNWEALKGRQDAEPCAPCLKAKDPVFGSQTRLQSAKSQPWC